MKASERLPLITCEHGGNDVPEEYRYLFDGRETLLNSHRGWDPGALLFARELALRLGAELIEAAVTRLLVDLNRSPGHRHVAPAARDGLAGEEIRRLMDAYYWPYRNRVYEYIRKAVTGGKTVLHLSAHSFTPELDGEVRNADIGLLYDPSRNGERGFCRHLKSELAGRCPGLRVRLNYPYRGTADGLTTYLRREFDGVDYLGVELELNQSFAAAGGETWRDLRRLLGEAVAVCAHSSAWNRV